MMQLIPIAAIALGLAACAKIATTAATDGKLSSLAGSEWGPIDGSDLFVQFKTKGEMSGFAGCNNFFGQYEQNGERLIVGPLAATRKACLDRPIMDKERAFMNALQDTHHIEATYKTLVLKNADGDVITTLRRRDWD